MRLQLKLEWPEGVQHIFHGQTPQIFLTLSRTIPAENPIPLKNKIETIPIETIPIEIVELKESNKKWKHHGNLIKFSCLADEFRNMEQQIILTVNGFSQKIVPIFFGNCS